MKNGPKQCKTHHLGHRYVNFLPSFNFFFLLFFKFRFYSCSKMTGRIQLGSDEKNRPKRHVLRHLGHRYVVFFRSCFTCFILFYLGSIRVLKRQAGLGWAVMGKTGPNDARRVIWTIGMCFFVLLYFYLFIYMFLGYKRCRE